VTAFCDTCFRLPPEIIERIAERVLHRVAPGASWHPSDPPWPRRDGCEDA
jgi:hypothetical protein